MHDLDHILDFSTQRGDQGKQTVQPGSVFLFVIPNRQKYFLIGMFCKKGEGECSVLKLLSHDLDHILDFSTQRGDQGKQTVQPGKVLHYIF
jgi:hypothetical protein